MKICILGWGSLVWDPRGLKTTGPWFPDGPMLPIEFARISQDGRLTLVIKQNHQIVPTLYTISSHTILQSAISNLQDREGSPTENNIGCFNFTNNLFSARPANTFLREILIDWNKQKRLDAVIWSDFSPKFQTVTGLPLQIENVISYLEGLSLETKNEALKYISNTPAQIKTGFRQQIEQHFGAK